MTTKGFNFAYIRVSTEEQNYESQMEAMKDLEFSKVLQKNEVPKTPTAPNFKICLIMLERATRFTSKIFQGLQEVQRIYSISLIFLKLKR